MRPKPSSAIGTRQRSRDMANRLLTSDEVLEKLEPLVLEFNQLLSDIQDQNPSKRVTVEWSWSGIQIGLEDFQGG